jgi:acyl-CoA thioester hydrolase
MITSLKHLTGEVAFRAPFPDADPAGVIWHGRYFDYFDAARCDLLAKVDYGYRAMAASGIIWPVVETKVRYVRPISFDDLVRVTATLVEWEYRLKIVYEIHDEAGRRCTSGYTVQVAVDGSTGELCFEVPGFLRERIDKYLGT